MTRSVAAVLSTTLLSAALAAACGTAAMTAAPPSSSAPAAGPTNAATTAPTVAATPQATAPGPVTFTSPLYRYTMTLPAGWRTAAAMLQWDGASSPGHLDGSVDKFVGPSTTSAFAYAAPVTSDLKKFVRDTNAWTVRDHGDTCPATAPETTESIEIGGEAGTLMSWNCGILINVAVTVHDGTGFVVVMRDPGVAAATDPTDRTLLEDLLDSVIFPS